MKLHTTLFAIIISLMISMPALAQEEEMNIMEQVSLWHEFHKNGDFVSALEHGWNVHKLEPGYVKYKFFKKMDEMLWFMHDSVAATPEEKLVFADTLLYIYSKGIEFDKKNKNLFLSRKAYVLETWYELPVEQVIEAYAEASNANPNLSDYYMDRFGMLYINNATDENGYKLKALEHYAKLADKDPENELWNRRMTQIAEDPTELADITEKAWNMDKENTERAFIYATNCMRIKDYNRAIVPFEFLVEKSPNVINYWNQLAVCYDKIDKVENALKAYKTLIDLQPDNRDNYLNIAILYKKIEQLSVARSYLQKASKVSPDWDYPHYIEAQIYEQAARNCSKDKFDFEDKVVYQLAVDTYRKAARKGGSFSGASAERANSLSTAVPSKEDYFFRKINAGQKIKVAGKCYDWIGRSITVPD